ncbi:MAG: DUF4214 domain-containing protein [Acidimicrobiales bacterium]|nr:DUF4214 domain-containing protein [Acidimicrobiales bacterium]
MTRSTQQLWSRSGSNPDRLRRTVVPGLILLAIFVTAAPVAARGEVEPEPGSIRVTAEVTPFTDTRPVGSGLAAVLAADGDSHFSLKGNRVAVVALELDGQSEMVTVQPLDDAGRGLEHSELAMRSRRADETWSEWTVLHFDGEEGPDGLPGGEGGGAASVGGMGAIGPIWVGEGAAEVEVALLHGDAAALATEALDVPDIEPSTLDKDTFAKGAEFTLAKGAEFTLAKGAEFTLAKGTVTWGAKPQIRSNDEWGTTGFQRATEGCEDGPRYADSMRAMVVHHTVTTNSYSQDEVPKLLRGIQRFHTVTRGWCDVAYNFLVDRFGTIWEGRSGGVDRPVIGGHARGFNSNTFAVALLGQHQSNISRPSPARPSSAALQSVKALGEWKLRLHGVDPNGRTLLKNTATNGVLKHPPATYVSVPTILGHRDLGQTSCPGNWTMPVVAEMKQEFTAKSAAAAVPYATDAITGNDWGPKLLAVDVHGGLRPAMGQAAPSPAPPGGDGAIAVGGHADAGYVLTKSGRVLPYGDAPAVSGRPGGSNPIDLIVRDSGKSGYVVTADGYLHAFGGQVLDRSSAGPAVAADINDAKVGYTVSASGVLNPVFNTPPATLRTKPSGTVVDISAWPEGHSGYVVTDRGEVIGYGEATSYGDVMTGRAVAIVAGPNRNGGWVLDSQGRWITFGDERPITVASTHAGSDIAVDAVLTGYDLTGSTFKKSSDYDYISGVLARFRPEQNTSVFIDHWSWKTDHGGTIVLGREIVHDARFTDSIVDDMYRRALGRRPDAAGKRYWSELLNSQRITLRDMGIYFFGSTELYARAGSSAAYVDSLYQALLHRAPDAAGRAYWAELLGSGRATPAEVTAGFYDSLESRRDRVNALYRRISGGSPSADQTQEWADDLLGSDDLTVAAQMIASPTFYRLLTD